MPKKKGAIAIVRLADLFPLIPSIRSLLAAIALRKRTMEYILRFLRQAELRSEGSL
jgi:hypothetical protein